MQKSLVPLRFLKFCRSLRQAISKPNRNTCPPSAARWRSDRGPIVENAEPISTAISGHCRNPHHRCLRSYLSSIFATHRKRVFLFQNPHIMREEIPVASCPTGSILPKRAQNALRFENQLHACRGSAKLSKNSIHLQLTSRQENRIEFSKLLREA